MWPISPAAPRPTHGLPSSTSPPPTPVPQKTPRSERYGFPAPSSNSAHVATLHVVADHDSGPERLPQPLRKRELRFPVGQVPRLCDRAGLWSTAPGEPTPTAASVAGLDTCGGGRLPHRPGDRQVTASGPPAVGVSSRASPSDRAVRADHDGLDLGPAEVGPAVQLAQSGSGASSDESA